VKEQEKLVIDRRGALIIIGGGVVSAVALMETSKILAKIYLDEFRNVSYIDRLGVLVSGESEVFSYKGQRMRAFVNPAAFRNTVDYIAEVTAKEKETDNFLNRFPLKILLHRRNDKLANASYDPSFYDKEPKLIYSTKFLHSYLDGLARKDGGRIRENDSTVIHEMIHMWQDAITYPIYEIKTGVKGAIVGLLTSSGYLAGVKDVEVSQLKDMDYLIRKQVQGVLTAMVGMAVGAEVASWDKVDFEELQNQAYKMAEYFASLAKISRYKGQYFQFEKA
jgi:hypothetical protein